MAERTCEFVAISMTHEVTVERIVNSSDAYYMVGVDCIDTEGMHVRASVISRHERRDDAIRHAQRLSEIIRWGRDDPHHPG